MAIKIDVTDIVRDHCATLVDEGRGKPGFWDWFLFLIVPIMLASILVTRGILLSAGTTTVMITTLSIFAALLFNLLLLAHSVIRDSPQGDEHGRIKRRLLQQIYANISYSILVSIVALVALLIDAIIGNAYVSLTVSFAVYFLVCNFLLTLLMVLKRIHVMLSNEFEA